MPPVPNVTPILLKGTTKYLEEWKTILDDNLPPAQELLHTSYKQFLDDKDPDVLAFEKLTRRLADIDTGLITTIVNTPHISDLLHMPLTDQEELYSRLRNGLSIFLAHLYGYDTTHMQMKAGSDLFILRRTLFQMKEPYMEKGKTVPPALDTFTQNLSVVLSALSELLRPRVAMLKVRIETVLYFQTHADGTEADAEAFAAPIAQKIPGAYLLVKSIIGRMFHPRMQLTEDDAAATSLLDYMMGGRRRKNRKSKKSSKRNRRHTHRRSK
jgi:hypothetical protein